MADKNAAITAALDQYYSDLDSKAKEDTQNAALSKALASLQSTPPPAQKGFVSGSPGEWGPLSPAPNPGVMGGDGSMVGKPYTKGQVAGTAIGLAGAPLLPETAIGGLLGSMLLGGVSGATQGAIDNPKDRFAGATSSGLTGAALGAIPGLAMGKGRPMGELPLPTKANLFLRMVKNLGLGNGAPEAAPAPPAAEPGLSYGPKFAGSRFSTEGERPIQGPVRGVKPVKAQATKATPAPAPAPLPPLQAPSDTFRSGAPIKLQSLEDIVSQLKNGPKKPTN